ncbi:MAG: IS1380 family transposase, partial [Cyanobacteria bacterium J06639_18]
DPAQGALEELQRVIQQIRLDARLAPRTRWRDVHILVRGDSAYSREEIMSWCESQYCVDYVFGLAKNSRLIKMAQATLNRAKLEYSKKLETVVSFLETLFTPDSDLTQQAGELIDPSIWYRSLDYQTRDSWSRNRRVVSKIEYGAKGTNIRFVVTSLPTNKVPPGELYQQKYCPRGEMENRFKEQQLELFSVRGASRASNRTSTHTFAGNQLRLWFSSIAYVLMNALREQCLVKTVRGASRASSLQNAQVGTIRTKLLKLGALITVSARRILIAVSSSCPYKHIFANAYKCLNILPNTT